MHKRVAFALALTVGLSCTSSALAAKTKHKYVVSSTVTAHAVSIVGPLVTVAGRVSDPLLGAGATVYNITATGATSSATFVEYNGKGSVSGTAVVTITPAADGSSTVLGDGIINGGTSAYKKAKGKIHITGTIDKDKFDHFVVTGTFKA